MSKASRQVKRAHKFTPLAQKYEPPYGPKATIKKIKAGVQGK